MAEKAFATGSPVVDERGSLFVDWGSIPSGDTGKPFIFPEYPDKTIQRYAGTGTVTVEGSMDGTTYGALHDPQGVAISLADAAPVVIAENPRYIRVSVSGAAASVAVTGAR